MSYLDTNVKKLDLDKIYIAELINFEDNKDAQAFTVTFRVDGIDVIYTSFYCNKPRQQAASFLKSYFKLTKKGEEIETNQIIKKMNKLRGSLWKIFRSSDQPDFIRIIERAVAKERYRGIYVNDNTYDYDSIIL